MGRSASGAKPQLVSPIAATSTLARIIRLNCIIRRAPTLRQLAADSGVSELRLRKIISNDAETKRTPRFDEALSILGVLGAEAVTAALSLIAMRAECDSGPDEALGQSVADILDEVGIIAHCAAAGTLNARTADTVIAAADRLEAEARGIRRSARKSRA